MTWSEIPWRPSSRVLRQFAALWLVVVGFFAWRVGSAGGHATADAWLGTLAGGVGGVGLAWPAAVRPLFVGLVVATLPLGWAMSRLFLAALFYGLFTPLALVFRVLGRDPLKLRRTNRPTYWQPKVIADDPRRYLRPF
jgi:hypothetical protein